MYIYQANLTMHDSCLLMSARVKAHSRVAPCRHENGILFPPIFIYATYIELICLFDSIMLTWKPYFQDGNG